MLDRPKASHIWAREEREHYVEPRWCSERLFDVEPFDGTIQDPCCGWGRVIEAARAAGHGAFGTDIINRGFPDQSHTLDFLEQGTKVANIAANPPFDIFRKFAEHALKIADRKVAMLWLVPRLNAAGWLRTTPLARVWLMTPRPSMPPGRVVEELLISLGKDPSGGSQDYCWLVWDKRHRGAPVLGWLSRDEVPA